MRTCSCRAACTNSASVIGSHLHTIRPERAPLSTAAAFDPCRICNFIAASALIPNLRPSSSGGSISDSLPGSGRVAVTLGAWWPSLRHTTSVVSSAIKRYMDSLPPAMVTNPSAPSGAWSMTSYRRDSSSSYRRHLKSVGRTPVVVRTGR